MFDAALADLANSLYFNNFVATAKGDQGVIRKKKYYLYTEAERDEALLNIPQIEAAIRVLEAAAKVTAQDLADGEWTRKVYPVLLAALPDAPKGKEISGNDAAHRLVEAALAEARPLLDWAARYIDAVHDKQGGIAKEYEDEAHDWFEKYHALAYSASHEAKGKEKP